MKVIKNILRFIIEPFRYINNKNFGERVVAFFQKHKFMYYLVAFLITLVIIFFLFVYEKLV